MMQSSRKPPLPRSPINLRLRSRRPLQSAATNIQSPPGSLVKPQFPKPDSDMVGSEIRPEYRTISTELSALAKMVRQELGGGGEDDGDLNANRSPIFQRGRFYEEYSARRNEMLKRKKAASSGHCLGVRVESAKKRDTITSSSKRLESLRKTVPCTPMADRVKPAAAAPPPSTSRYLLRSRTATKENKKPPSYAAYGGEMSADIGLKKVTVRRGRRI